MGNVFYNRSISQLGIIRLSSRPASYWQLRSADYNYGISNDPVAVTTYN